jgi:fatty-acyl-CoA synthase
MSKPVPQPWVDGLTIPQALDRTVERSGDRDALVFPKLGLRLTYREFPERVDEVARGLLGLGIKTGEHVAIWATNVPEWVLMQFATARIGAVLVTINPAYRAHELRYVLKQSDSVALVLTDRFKTSDYFAMLAEVCPECTRSCEIKSAEFPKLRHVIAIKGEKPAGTLAWNDLLDAGKHIDRSQLETIGKTLKPLDAINIQYTSGTTGFPKAATLSHRNLLLDVFYSGACQALTDQDRVCIPVPFYHCFGCVLGTLMASVYGAAMVVPAESFDPKATLDAIEQERCTALYGVPTMFIAQLNDPTLAGRDLTSLRTGIMAGSPCPIETMRAVVNTLGCREMTIGYGQTEASPIITQTRTDDPIELRVETVGRPLPGVEVRIVDPASGEALGDNQQGELCTRGPIVMLG